MSIAWANWELFLVFFAYVGESKIIKTSINHIDIKDIIRFLILDTGTPVINYMFYHNGKTWQAEDIILPINYRIGKAKEK